LSFPRSSPTFSRMMSPFAAIFCSVESTRLTNSSVPTKMTIPEVTANFIEARVYQITGKRKPGGSIDVAQHQGHEQSGRYRRRRRQSGSYVSEAVSSSDQAIKAKRKPEPGSRNQSAGDVIYLLP